MKKKIFLFGWFGENNVGDDALLKQTIKTINNINNKVEITVFSNNCQNLEKDNFDNNIKFKDKSKKMLIKALTEYDIYIFGPGGLFPNKDLKKIIFMYLYITLLKLKHKKVIFLGLGIENCNFKDFLSKYIIKKIMEKVDDCTLRYDINMYKEQRKLKEKCKVSSDVMFLKEYPKLKKSKTKYVVVSLANIFKENNYKYEFIETISKFLSKLIKDGYELHFLTFTDKVDYELNNLVINNIYEKDKCKNISFTKNLDLILKEFSEATLAIGMRFHSLVFATNVLTPFISISYSSKNEELLKDFKLERLSKKICVDENKYFCKIINLKFNEINDIYCYIQNNYDKIKSIIAKELQKEKEKAQKHIDMLNNFIK